MSIMFTIQEVRDYLDRMDISSYIDEDGDLLINFNADESFPYDVFVIISVSDEGRRLAYIAGCSEYKPVSNLLELANYINANRNFPTAVVRNGELRMEMSVYLTEEVSPEFVVESCYRIPLSSLWNAFVDVFDEDCRKA